MKNLYIRYALLLTAFCLLTSCAFAKATTDLPITTEKKTHGGKFCDSNHGNYYNNGKKYASKKDLREITIPAGGLIEVDGRQNGGISVKGENRGDILIRACVRANGKTEADAITALNNTRIETSGVIKAVNADENAKVYVSYQLLVPMQQDLKLTAHNGGISIRSVDGNLRFETVNGGLSLKNVAGDVKGSTTNGGVSVRLSGNSFNGSGLDVTTTNGGIKLVLPKNYAADIETGTVNGGFRSDFSELQVKKDGKNRWDRSKKINSSINGGGTKIRVVTTNGGVKIASTE